MNNDIVTLLTLMWILMAISGVFAYKSFQAVMAFREILRRRKEYPYVESAHQDLLCKGPHKWDQMKLALAHLPVGVYTVCTECGFISGEGMDYKLNKPALEVYKNNLKIREENKAKWDRILLKKQAETQKIMNQMIKSHVAEFSGDLHANIKVLEQFFRKSTIELENLYSTLNKDDQG